MKKVVLGIIAVVAIYLVSLKVSEIAYSLGFVEISKQAVLVNEDNLKEECRVYAWGFFDQIELENRFQSCINEHEANGYKLIENSDD